MMIDRYIQEVPKYLKRKQKNKKYTNIHHKHDLLLTYVDIERGLIYYEKYRCKICGEIFEVEKGKQNILRLLWLVMVDCLTYYY